MSCFGDEVSSDSLSEPGHTLISNLSFANLLASYSSTLPPFTFFFLLTLIFNFRLFLLLLCVPLPSIFVAWLHRTHEGLDQWSHRNCAALVGSWGSQGGQECGKRERETDVHTHTWLTGCFEDEAPCDLIPIVVAVVST